ncbi:MarR family winged helix-turn-helix transcriptional regulator [Falsirhodobacter halotolerans]|uniref:MarR family winged helix-turn-helix transcriptional regulator n=1 Tax=Falsirhodobacter halotolerans TaxID=1146892 RepID=UPI001FD2E622|nr:MarR family transcriptional regulator [Falsirhodobacter halotolerans]MCJ8139919.1 winged helix DNA-binding protein [Falsirhodobacter halotolerans]
MDTTISADIIDGTTTAMMSGYLETLSLVERMHRLLLDVVKDEFERLGVLEINSVQALLLFNIGAQEVTAGELKSRGFYQGSNVSYNLRKLVDLGYMHHERSATDRRSVRVRLTDKGLATRAILSDLFRRHATGLGDRRILSLDRVEGVNAALRNLERYWTDQIRYIY